MYKVKLQNFEGPLDLLLFFIKRDELDIYDIPIAKITQEFFEYIHLMQMLDLEFAGEFILTAAELMHIKVRMLLPRVEGEEEEEDPRAELVRRLIEYKRYKEMAMQFATMEEEQRKIYYRQFFKNDPKTYVSEDDGLKDVTLFDLIAAFQYAMEHAPKKLYHEIELVNVTIDEQIDYIKNFFASKPQFTFLELISPMREKVRIVVTFIALLELIKNKVIGVRQDEPYQDILIYKIQQDSLIPSIAE